MRFENLQKKQVKDGRLPRWNRDETFLQTKTTETHRQDRKKEKCRNAKETKHQLWSPHFSCYICCESSEECEASEKKTQKERQIKKMLLLLTSYYSLTKNTLSHLQPNCVIVIILYLRLHTREAKESWSPPSGQLTYRSTSTSNCWPFLFSNPQNKTPSSKKPFSRIRI